MRWLVLVAACLMMVGNYYCYDNPAALHTQLEQWVGKPSNYGKHFRLKIPSIILLILFLSFRNIVFIVIYTLFNSQLLFTILWWIFRWQIRSSCLFSSVCWLYHNWTNRFCIRSIIEKLACHVFRKSNIRIWRWKFGIIISFYL